MNEMEKVIRDGKVAVLYSPGFGAGWSTWNSGLPELVFHPDVVAMVESGNKHHIESWADEKYPGAYVCVLGASDLKIEWVPIGTHFIINEYDGSESIQTNTDTDWHTA